MICKPGRKQWPKAESRLFNYRSVILFGPVLDLNEYSCRFVASMYMYQACVNQSSEYTTATFRAAHWAGRPQKSSGHDSLITSSI